MASKKYSQIHVPIESWTSGLPNEERGVNSRLEAGADEVSIHHSGPRNAAPSPMASAGVHQWNWTRFAGAARQLVEGAIRSIRLVASESPAAILFLAAIAVIAIGSAFAEEEMPEHKPPAPPVEAAAAAAPTTSPASSKLAVPATSQNSAAQPAPSTPVPSSGAAAPPAPATSSALNAVPESKPGAAPSSRPAAETRPTPYLEVATENKRAATEPSAKQGAADSKAKQEAIPPSTPSRAIAKSGVKAPVGKAVVRQRDTSKSATPSPDASTSAGASPVKTLQVEAPRAQVPIDVSPAPADPALTQPPVKLQLPQPVGPVIEVEPHPRRTSVLVVVAWSMAFAIGLIALFVVSRVGLRPRRVAANGIDEHPTGRAGISLKAPVPDDGSEPRKSTSVVQHAYVAPADLLAALERQFPGRVRRLAAGAHALTSIAGARAENEDYALAFGLATPGGAVLDCLVIADGCGGHPGGRDASHLASRFAAESLAGEFGLPPNRMVENAFAAASLGMREVSKYWGPRDLRSTLVVIVATASTYHIGWIGDGGCVVHRAHGNWLSLITPHRGAAQNLLAASLGPTQEGAPSFTVERRFGRDVLYAGTDGVLDVVQPAEFFAWFEDEVGAGHAAQATLEALLSKCGLHPAFDDNLTVAVLRTAPRSISSPLRPIRVATKKMAA